MRLASATAIPLETSTVPPRAAVEKAARELETQFARMLIKTMRSASMGDPMLGNDTTYREMYDQQLATELSKGRGLGLAPMIARQLQGDRHREGGGDMPSNGMPSNGMPLDRMPSKGMLLNSIPLNSIPLNSIPLNSMPLNGIPLNGLPSTGMPSNVMPAPAAALRMPNVSTPAPPMQVSAATAGGLSLMPSSSGVSMPALAVPAWSPPTPAAVGFDLADCPDTPVDCSSPEAFARSIWPQAQKVAVELGVPAKALVAQAALETGWGRRLAREGDTSSHNLFGIKAGSRWSGARVNAGTHEFVNGMRVNERADFRAYGSAAESFADYARLLRNERYAQARGTGDDIHGFASALQRAGYATDPRYAAKITAIANGDTLTRALAALPDVAATGNVYAANGVGTHPPATAGTGAM